LKPSSFGKEDTGVYWYNPKSRSSERVAAPSTDEEAIQMLAGHPDSATFVSEYAELRQEGMEIETALTLVGHQFRPRHNEHLQASHERPSRPRLCASGYELLLAVRLREGGREGGGRRSVYRS
jgi:hypothetical protein